MRFSKAEDSANEGAEFASTSKAVDSGRVKNGWVIIAHVADIGAQIESMVDLMEISAASVREIASLRVSAEQSRYVASNALSIAEAHFEPAAWFRGIRADEGWVGFAMLFDHTMPGALHKKGLRDNEIGLWRLMIDSRFQGRGFGQSALGVICDYARSRPGIDHLLTSYAPGPYGPQNFYMRYGFVETGGTRNNGTEVEIVLPLG